MAAVASQLDELGNLWEISEHPGHVYNYVRICSDSIERGEGEVVAQARDILAIFRPNPELSARLRRVFTVSG